MKTCSLLSRWFQISVALFATALLVRAETGKLSAGDGGLQMSVNTAAYRVYAGDPVPVQVRKRSARAGINIVRMRDVLVASVNLANRSPHDLKFSFPDDPAADRKFDFRVLNSQGEEVWTSGAAAPTAVETAVTATLRKRSKWSSVVQIPLKQEGVWLAPGIYTVEASLAGEPKIGATTLFEVAVPPTPEPQPEAPKDTGIKGQVLRAASMYVRLDGTVISPAVMPSGTKATVTIQQIVQDEAQGVPFFWTGETAADGRFQVNTPPGRFRVRVVSEASANTPPHELDLTLVPAAAGGTTEAEVIPRVLPPREVQKEVTVRRGEFSTVELVLSGGIQYEQPRADTGVKGQVFVPTATNEMVVAPGANVIVEETRAWLEGNTDTAITLRLPFRRKVVADAEGRFQVNTPPGRFRVTAYWTDPATQGQTALHVVNPQPLQITLPMRGSKEVQVTTGQFTETRLDLKPGLVEIGTRQVYSVSSVELRPLPTFAYPSMIELSAKGMVNSGGWSNGQLRQRGITPDGIIEFDFVAKPPEGVATQAFQSISSGVVRMSEPPGFRGVRIYAQTNNEEASLLAVPK